MIQVKNNYYKFCIVKTEVIFEKKSKGLKTKQSILVRDDKVTWPSNKYTAKLEGGRGDGTDIRELKN